VLDFDQVWPQVDGLANDQYFNQIPATKQDIFGIPELTPIDSYFSPNNSPTQFQPEPVQSRTISVYRSSLLENLAKHSVCLGTGPAYPRASVDIAIESAIR
jgi:hypothetical protein